MTKRALSGDQFGDRLFDPGPAQPQPKAKAQRRSTPAQPQAAVIPNLGNSVPELVKRAESAIIGGRAPVPLNTQGTVTLLNSMRQPWKPKLTDPTTGGEQLQMFMTPHEIHAKYQGLMGDRVTSQDLMDAGEMGSYKWTANSGHGSSSEGWYMPGDSGHPGGSRAFYRTEGGNRQYVAKDETEDEMWARKLHESKHERPSAGEYGMPGRGSKDFPNPNAALHARDPKESLYESIERRGVLGPVHLSQTVGDLGKPQIVGGQHRIAAATDIDPDQPIPVQHWADILHAKTSGDYS